jgi:hypothetical protein
MERLDAALVKSSMHALWKASIAYGGSGGFFFLITGCF